MKPSFFRRVFGFQGGQIQGAARMGVKLVFCTAVWKLFFDVAYQYLKIDRRMLPQNFMQIPRIANIVDDGSPALPPLMPPFVHDEESRKQNELYDKMMVTASELPFGNFVKRHYLYSDYPSRQNPDRIDHYLRLSLVERRKQILNLKTAEKIEREGGQLLNINNFLRRLEQCELQKLRGPVIPQL